MNSRKAPFRSTVVLTAFGDEGALVEQVHVKYDDYYGDTNTLIDDYDHIRQKRIRVIMGEIYNSGGNIQSAFTNFYNNKGEYIRGRAIHADGTVVQD